ncbi:MAG: histidine kinase [Bacteroidota bacterium]|nr:histidine kinase [Bacteroidota bacterium]
MKINSPAGKNIYILLHILAWAILFLLPLYIFIADPTHDINFFIRNYIHAIEYLLIFYLNYFWLVPKLLFKSKQKLYFIAASLLIILIYLIFQPVDDHLVPHDFNFEKEMNALAIKYRIPRPSFKWHIYNYFITSMLVTGFSMGLKMSNKLIQNEKEKKELEKERLNSELAFLKNQISPHFFFNTLNNIYSLIQINTDDAQKAVSRLSKLMRYLLYESESGNTTLSREIEFMRNYINLMELRLTNKVKFTVSFPQDFSDVEIPPLLFIPFLENAFKHGISYRDSSFIDISMKIDSNQLTFNCSNSIYGKTQNEIENQEGIGLENVRKRLNLLFPDRHHLSILQEENIFSVLLTIQLNK